MKYNNNKFTLTFVPHVPHRIENSPTYRAVTAHRYNSEATQEYSETTQE